MGAFGGAAPGGGGGDGCRSRQRSQLRALPRVILGGCGAEEAARLPVGAPPRRCSTPAATAASGSAGKRVVDRRGGA